MRDFEETTLTGKEEAQLQYEYLEKAKAYVAAKEQEKGRKLTYCVQTFGCPMVIVTQKCGNPLFI